ncbi:hypothetical protein [Calothrix rhizosoleniae]|nr:hypothetical protein [Calothrix rhizosoleniae]
MISKIEAIVYSFRAKFPDCFADLKPWAKNDTTKQFTDPNSIDIGFHFPNANFDCRCRSILMQVRIHRDFEQQDYKAVGIQLSGYEAYREQWQFSTIGHWEFSGISNPTSEAQELLKQVCCQIIQLFDNSQSAYRQ